MPSFISVDASNIRKKHVADDISEVYKKVGFRNPEGFDLLVQWKVMVYGEPYHIQIYAKTKGRKQTPTQIIPLKPMEQITIYGSYAAVRIDPATKLMLDLNVSEMEHVLNVNAQRYTEYPNNTPPEPEPEPEPEPITVAEEPVVQEEPEPAKKKTAKTPAGKRGKKQAPQLDDLVEETNQPAVVNVLRCTNELVEESYL